MSKKTIVLPSVAFALASCLSAAPVLVTGTPGNSSFATPTGPTPSFGALYNFDSLAPNSTFAPNTYAASGVTISSPDGLTVLPFSTQSAPNELFDASSDGSANITISLTTATNEIGIGIADADGVPVTLQALNASGAALGSPFSVTLPNSTVNPYNGYYAVSDTSYDIYGLAILQPVGGQNFSGLAIDDLQVNPTPEPSTLAVSGFAVALLAFARRVHKRC